MMETDDRLADDPVWELFPSALPQDPRPRRFRYGLAVVILDWLSHPVLADKPGMFGPKVPAVGKWNW